MLYPRLYHPSRGRRSHTVWKIKPIIKIRVIRLRQPTRPCSRGSLLFSKNVGVYYSPGRYGSLLASRGDVGVFKLCLSESVRIQVSCSAEDHSAVRDGRFPVSKYSRTSLYIAGHLPHLDTSSNQAIKQPSQHIYHTFQHFCLCGQTGSYEVWAPLHNAHLYSPPFFLTKQLLDWWSPAQTAHLMGAWHRFPKCP